MKPARRLSVTAFAGLTQRVSHSAGRYYLLPEAILNHQPIRVFNHGDLRRNFTYIVDIVAGVSAALDRPPQDDGGETLEKALGGQARKQYGPMRPGDVEATCADTDASICDLGYAPVASIEEGIPRFAAWRVEWIEKRRREGECATSHSA